MFASLKKIFSQTELATSKPLGDLQLLCGLMIEAANVDGVIDKNEINKISISLTQVFHEKQDEVDEELNKCLNEISDNKSLHYFTSKINQTFTEEKKIILIEVLWEIILEDEDVHDFESNLIRRLAGLLYISDFECGKARKKAFLKLNNED